MLGTKISAMVDEINSWEPKWLALKEKLPRPNQTDCLQQLARQWGFGCPKAGSQPPMR